jgi:hypothetical protein
VIHALTLASRLEYRARWDLAVLENAPQRHRQTPRERHDTDAPQPLASTRKALVAISRRTGCA